jgi:hypothetical protein
MGDLLAGEDSVRLAVTDRNELDRISLRSTALNLPIQLHSELVTLTIEERRRYIDSWRTYRILRNITMSGITPYLLVRSFYLDRRPGAIWSVVTMVVLLVTMPAAFGLEYWKCPRCQRRFSGGWLQGWVRQPWVQKCYWCQLQKRDLHALYLTSPKPPYSS